MANKTWNIGEQAKGGVITVEIHGKVIIVIGKDWDTSKGWSRKSDQSGAKEFTRGTIASTDTDARNKIDDFLNDLTTSFFADEILEWIESKVKLSSEFDW